MWLSILLAAPFVTAELPEWFELDVEYRVRTQYIDPLDLNGTAVTDIDWTEQRARVRAAVSHGGWLTIRTRADILDGVLLGDNGSFAREPSPNSGLSLASKRPNDTGFGVGLRPGADPLDPNSYEPTFRRVEPIEIDHFYADVALPLGVLRVGRQPMEIGVGMGAHDGERHNRWGVSSFGDIADRALFATKIDEAVRVVLDPGHRPDPRIDRGLIWATYAGLGTQGALPVGGDNLVQVGTGLIWRVPEAIWFGLRFTDVGVSQVAVNVGGDAFETEAWAFPSKLQATVEDRVHVSFMSLVLRGETRELSEGTAPLRNGAAQVQPIEAHGMHALADLFVGPLTLTMEFDWATGDDDPRGESPITVFNFPRDKNVGLLLFERVLAFQSARAAAVGIENLHALDAASFPFTEIATEGRFTNARALFPQVKMAWVQTPEHALHTRFGALFAWSDVGVVDPVQTVIAEDGTRIDDDAVNFAGGRPGSYLGTELDLQVEWTYREHFVWTVEAAWLRPGDALEDEHGDAVDAFLVENRFLYLF